MEEEYSLSQAQALTEEQITEMMRPIRELSAAWNMPLTDYLDNFLQRVVSHNIESVDDIPNFSQAGLFLQGSTNIFSKKVKYLYEVAMNSSTAIETDTDQEGKPRKRKVIDWVVDDVLAPIDDPDEVDTLLSPEDDHPRLEITTLPQVPFCLLHSLDSSDPSKNQKSYRIKIVPDQEHSVILVDPSYKFVEHEAADPGETVPHPLGIGLAEEEEEHGEEAPIPEGEDVPPPEMGDDMDEGEAPPPAFGSDIEEEPEADEVSFKTLDADDAHLAFAARPFKKMNLEKMKLPHSFGDEVLSQKAVSKKPFHENIFAEIFAKVKTFREQMQKEQDRDALLAIPEESGRDHIIQDMDVYVEPPPMPDEEFELADDGMDMPRAVESEPRVPGLLSQEEQREMIKGMKPREAYNFLCHQFIQMMIATGQTKVNRTANSEMLALWERRLGPALEKEMSKKPFNVAELRELIKARLEQQDGEMTFRNLCSGAPPHEVSRIFLCLLMMANTNMIKIVQQGEIAATEDFIVKLINPDAPVQDE